MLNYIKGKVTGINKDSIILESNNIGYKIYNPNPYSFKNDEQLQIFTYLYLKNEVLTLYGFRTQEELSLFLQLISVSGIGPKSALAMLGTGSVDLIVQAIHKGDSKYLCKFPGIGSKSAQQIILDLKGKISIETTSSNYQVIEDVHDALLVLGYKESDIRKVLPKLDSTKETSELIKDALKLILQ